MCPFAWMTSKWVRMVAAQRDYSVDWRFISLRIINADVDYAAHFPADYEDGHTAGLRLLRVAARVRAEHGRAAVGSLYSAIGTRLFDTPRDDPLSAADQGARQVLEPLLRDVGLPSDLADALDDTTFDDVIRDGDRGGTRADGSRRRHTDPALQTAWRDGVLRPCDQPTASPDDAGRLWDHVIALTSFPASRRSSAACANDLSWPASASTPNRLASRRTGTAAAVAPEVGVPSRFASHECG